MTLAQLVPLTLKVSIAVLVFTIGLGTPASDLTYFLRAPGRLARSLLAMSIIMPIIAVAIDKVFELNNAVEITLVALAMAPIPPILPRRLFKIGANHAYVMGLLFTASLLSMALIPLGAWILDAIFPAHIEMRPGPVAVIVLTSILAPMLAGVLVGRLAPKLAERVAGPLGAVANVILMIGVAILLVKIGPVMLAQVGNGTLIAIAAFVVIGLVVGHLLGPPTPAGRTVLALATASRHPGLAIAIARLNFPDEKAVPATVLLYLLVSLALTIPYVAWRARVMARNKTPPATA